MSTPDETVVEVSDVAVALGGRPIVRDVEPRHEGVRRGEPDEESAPVDLRRRC